jgi:hypothetical protein
LYQSADASGSLTLKTTWPTFLIAGASGMTILP